MYPNVRAELARKGLTQEKVAERMGIADGTLSGKLNGRYQFTLNEARRLKEILETDIPIEELFKEAG